MLTRQDAIAALEAGAPHNLASAPWTRRFIEIADAQFSGAWHERTLTGQEALEILLPPHAGEPCKGDRLTLVDPEGATVRDVARRLAQIRADYEPANRSCWSRIEAAASAPYSRLILTTAPLDSDDYRGMSPRPDRLYHLDGFHRLVAWGWTGRLAASGARIAAIVAGKV